MAVSRKDPAHNWTTATYTIIGTLKKKSHRHFLMSLHWSQIIENEVVVKSIIVAVPESPFGFLNTARYTLSQNSYSALKL